MIENSLILLPYDVLLNIFKNLDLHDLRNLMLTCKTLRNLIISENAIWKWAFRNKLILREHNNSHSKPLSYYNQCRISHNWSKGIYRNKVIIQHHANYMPWLKLLNSDTLFLSLRSNITCYSIDRKGFPNCRCALWNVDVPTVFRNDVRTNDISRFVVKDNILVCGNRDGSTAIYNYNCRQKPSLLYHIRDCHENGKVEVTAVEFAGSTSNPCVITASGDSSKLSLWYWKLRENSHDPLPQLEHHVLDCDADSINPIKLGLRSLAVNQSQDKLAIGLNKNCMPIFLDINTCSLLTRPNENRVARHVVRDIHWHDEHTVVLVAQFGTMQLVDNRTNSVVYEASDPFNSSLYCVKSDGHRAIVVGSAQYSRCVLFDARFKDHLQIYFTQKTPSPIYSLDFDSTKLIAAADRNTAALNFNVNASAVPARDYSYKFQIV